MKTIWKELLVCTVLGLALPGAMMKITSGIKERDPLQTVTAEITEETEFPKITEPIEPAEATEPPQPAYLIPVRWADGTLRQMELEEYLLGVVLAEMPADFEQEALKAQSVAARTYAAKICSTGGKHGDGSICTDSGCCQAYISEAAYLDRGGSQSAVDRVRQAVEETAGQVLTYGGELIEATYFSCSGGFTEDAAAVWGADFPYLQAVESPGEEDCQYYTDQVVIPKQRLETLLGMHLPEDPGKWLGEVTLTHGGGVAAMEIGGRIFKGTELRTLLGLRSTAFTAAAEDQGLVVETRGFGHRVGLSQYGADAMAATGKNYEEILSHYYRGTELTFYNPDPS